MVSTFPLFYIFPSNRMFAGRVYEQFWTQTPFNTAMFSNMPIKKPPRDEIYFDYFPAKHVVRYLDEYVDHQKYSNLSLRQRILLDEKVVKVNFSQSTKQWQIFCDGKPQPLFATHLLVAAGLTSRPNMPRLPHREAFHGTIIHHVDFGRSPILKDPEVEHVAVLGGAKSAADVAYAAAKAGKKVSWIIRKSGNGPAHFAPGHGGGPYNNSNEILFNRLVSKFSPSMWNRQNPLSRALHGNAIGRTAIDAFWTGSDRSLRQEAQYRGQRGVNASENGFANLEPDTT